jgi:hypothetical protein
MLDSAKKKSKSLSLRGITSKRGPQPDKGEVIRKYAVTFPNMSAREIAAATAYSYSYISKVLSIWRAKQEGVKIVKYLSEAFEDEKEFGNSNVDLVNHPPHYTTGGIETIDFIEAKQLSYNLGNVVKYITRADHKGNRKQDLMKARWYLDREITKAAAP